MKCQSCDGERFKQTTNDFGVVYGCFTFHTCLRCGAIRCPKCGGIVIKERLPAGVNIILGETHYYCMGCDASYDTRMFEGFDDMPSDGRIADSDEAWLRKQFKKMYGEGEEDAR